MNGEEVLVPLIAIVSIAAVFIAYFTNRNRERMAMIEKGIQSDEIKAMHAKEVHRDPLNSLKWGIIFTLAGIAIVLGNYLRDQYRVDDPIIIGMICLFVGIGLVLFYLIASKKSGS